MGPEGGRRQGRDGPRSPPPRPRLASGPRPHCVSRPAPRRPPLPGRPGRRGEGKEPAGRRGGLNPAAPPSCGPRGRRGRPSAPCSPARPLARTASLPRGGRGVLGTLRGGGTEPERRAAARRRLRGRLWPRAGAAPGARRAGPGGAVTGLARSLPCQVQGSGEPGGPAVPGWD